MLPQAPPCALQRSHWKRYPVGEFVHEPWLPVSFFPTLACPAMCGGFFADGEATTSLLRLESAAVVPAAFVAETRASSVWPLSAAVKAYVDAVAPGMAAQPLPSAAHRSHWSAIITGEFQVPLVVDSFLPTAATPESTG